MTHTSLMVPMLASIKLSGQAVSAGCSPSATNNEKMKAEGAGRQSPG